MSISKWLILATVVGAVVAGSACTQKAADQTTNTAGTVLDNAKHGSETAFDASKTGVDKALDATGEGAATVYDKAKEAGEKTADATKSVVQKTGEETKEIAVKTANKTTEIAGEVGHKTKEIVSTTGEAITDGWITTKVTAKFHDETLLRGSDINVDTDNHVVTLKGTVGSGAAKARAAAIARGTEGVSHVINQLVVRG
jgi:osmotically-inducible protein OsmY